MSDTTIRDEPAKSLLNGAASATSETVEQLKIAVGAEPRRVTADDAGLPDTDLVGYQGSEAELAAIRPVLRAVASPPPPA